MDGRRSSTDTIPRLDHAVVGNGRVLALIAPTSAIEWSCWPRFDSPSVFARILDEDEGGTFRVRVGGREIAGEARYVRNTNVLVTTFRTEGAAFEIVDFAPRIVEGLDVGAPLELVRIVRPLHGVPRITIDFDPRPDYARVRPRLRESEWGIVVDDMAVPLHLATNVPATHVLARREFALEEPAWFVLSHGPRERRPDLAALQHDLDATVAGWRAWSKTCALPLFEPEAVLRSALCLALHVHHDTGAIVAAATTSVPEAFGTERTWDYRYCWLRDAAFVVEALRRLSHLREGERFLRWLRDVVESGPLQPVYGIGGETRLDEETLHHLAGFGGNGHVRVGNAASRQRQNDLTGEVILCIATLLDDPRLVHTEPESWFPLVRRLVEEAIAAAPEPDTGIWEFRTALRHHTFSKAMGWVAIERGAALARRFGHEDLARAWRRTADALRAEVLVRGYNAELGFFTQGYDGVNPDASNLLLPTLGLVDARDPRFLSTLDAYRERLVDGGLMMRYRHDDDFGSTTSAFTICSFWWAEALAMAGRLDEAVEVFRRVAAHANPLGLFSEDVDPRTGRLLGNFPQAYTHVGLVHAATTIGELLDAREGRVRAWA